MHAKQLLKPFWTSVLGVFLLCAGLAQGQAPATTEVQFSIYNTPTSVRVVLQSAFTTADGYYLSQGYELDASSPTGNFDLHIPPNAGGTPSNTFYYVYYTTPTNSWRETWIVPQSGAVLGRADVTATALPSTSSNYQIAFSQIKPPVANCAELGGFVQYKTDGTVTCNATSSQGGSGTVTSVGLSMPAWLTVAGSPVTTLGTLAVTATGGQTANHFLATPDGAAGPVGLRGIVLGDLPTGIPNAKLANSNLTLNTTSPLAGGGAVSLGGSLTLSCPTCVTSVPAQVYPGAGVANSTGSGWGTSYGVGVGANDLVQLDATGALPALSAAHLTGFPTLNQNTTGNAATASACATTNGCWPDTAAAIDALGPFAFPVQAAQLPTPSPTTLGGVKSVAAAAHKVLTAIGTDGLPVQAQLACGDLTDATLCNANSTGSGAVVEATSPTLATPNLGTPSLLHLDNADRLPCSALPARTGDATASAGSCAMTVATMTGDSGSGGVKGLVPAPAAGDAAAKKYLSAGGTWSVPAGGSSSGLAVSASAPSADSLTGTGATVPFATTYSVAANTLTAGSSWTADYYGQFNANGGSPYFAFLALAGGSAALTGPTANVGGSGGPNVTWHLHTDCVVTAAGASGSAICFGSETVDGGGSITQYGIYGAVSGTAFTVNTTAALILAPAFSGPSSMSASLLFARVVITP